MDASSFIGTDDRLVPPECCSKDDSLPPSSVLSREELYGQVQDLCSHGYGPDLYRELIVVLDRASFLCVKRLVQPEQEHVVSQEMGVSNSETARISGLFLKNCHVEETSRRIFLTRLGNENGRCNENDRRDGNGDLENVWSVYSDYLKFLNCVRNIFLCLDRMFLYLPPYSERGMFKEGMVIERNASGSVSFHQAMGCNASANVMDVADDALLHDDGGASNDKGKDASMELDRVPSRSGALWDLWDVGIYCLYKHFAMFEEDAVLTPSGLVDSEMECTDTTSPEKTKFSIVQWLKQRIVECIVAELDLLKTTTRDSSHSTTISSMDGIDPSTLHKSLVRNCVSMFCSFALVSHSKGYDVHRDLLRDVVKQMTTYFKQESEHWMSTNNADAKREIAPSKTSYDASGLLHQIDRRLRQVKSMTVYYHLVIDRVPGGTVSVSQRRRRGQILVQLVEECLLTPHFTRQYLLHPINLFPILDQDENSCQKDAKLLFHLSKRCKNNSSTALLQSNTMMIASSAGMELLRQSFEEYGKERGYDIMRQKVSLPPSSVSPTKPPPPMTTREMNHQMVVNLLQYKAHLEYLLREAFDREENFAKSFRKVLETVLNDSALEDNEESMQYNRRRRYGNDSDGGKRIAELLAKYMDVVLKNTKASSASTSMRSIMGANKEMSPQKPSGSLDNDSELLQLAVLDLFRHIQSKDVFEAFYRQDLAKRLLLNKSSSIDAERSFVSKLRSECGSGYTSKMEGMFKDIELSGDVMSNYLAHVAGLENSPDAKLSESASNSNTTKLDMEVQVLTTGYWPVHAQHPDIILPQPMLNKRDEFDAFYKSKYQGRRIAWQNGLGNCIVKAHFPLLDGPRELNVSLCQALVLMCFNMDESGNETALNIQQIMQKTGISDRSEAERVLQSLSMGREGTRVLQRLENQNPSDDTNNDDVLSSEVSTPRKKHKVVRKSISDSDLFTFNSNFTSNQRRIRITNIQMKETASDRKKTHESVILDRLHLIDAAIVRIMKARKTLSHRDLLGEVMNQLKFPALAVDIKKRIESLIEREYLERVEGDVSTYNYLA